MKMTSNHELMSVRIIPSSVQELRKMLRSILAIPFAIGIWLLFVFLILLWVIFAPFKLFVWGLSKCFNLRLVSFMHEGYSFVFAHLNPSKANIVTTTTFFAPVSVETIQKLFQERVLDCEHNGYSPYAKFRQTWTHFCGYAFWKWDDGFDVKNHVRVYDYEGELKLPFSCSQKDLERVTGKLLAIPWKSEQCPWEYLVVYGFKDSEAAQPGMAHIFRRHHALMDGFSRVKMFQNLCQAPDPTKPKFVNFESPKCLSIPNPLTAAKAIYDAGKLYVDYANVLGAWRVPSLSNDLRTVCTRKIPVELVKDIKNKHGVSYACVLYCVVGAAIRRMLKAAGKSNVKDVGLFLALPKKNHPGGMVNHLHTNYLRLQIASKSPSQQLKTMQRILDEAAGGSSMAPVAVEWVFSILAQLPYVPVYWYGRFYPWFNMIFSNFPVQDGPRYFEGSEVMDQFGCMGTMVRPFGCTVVACGVNGNQRLCITMDRSVLPQGEALEDLKEYISDELKLLLATEPQEMSKV